MFKPQKPQQSNQPLRHKMPIVERAPKQEDVVTLFTNAQRMRGTIIELPIKPNSSSQTFSITCQFDHSANETVWSMTAADGNLLWSIPQSDLDLVFDMVVMACQPQGMGSSTQMPPELAPRESAPAQTETPTPSYQQAPPPPPPPQPQHQNPAGYPQQQAPYQAPYQQPPQQYPPAQGGYQGQPYGQPAPYPAQAPYAQPPQGYPATGYGAPPPAPAAQPAQAPIWNPPPGPAPSSAPPNYPTPELTNFIDLLNKGQPNLLLGHLFVEAGIVPERCLDAGLKLQEMVRDGKLTDSQAILALKKASELGGQLDDAVIEWAKNPEKAKKPMPSGAKPQGNPGQATAGAQSGSKPGVDAATMGRIIDLLKQSGLVSEADIETATKVKSKHGGDLGQILVSAGKIGGKTLEAAAECQEYIRFGRLRIDKAIMALHYCERMRAGLKDAMDELSITLD
ncbi:MAG: hypothetical protein K2X77_28295 [Candidatus Obscuribacterales bacterium]|nr:hypothetical protein [Candidatus Obscuribacterales bacterium]